MDRIEMVERLREKAGVSYEDAKAALETADWDLLDAVVLLEKEGKVQNTGYTQQHRTNTSNETQSEPQEKKSEGDGFEKFMAWVGRVIHKGNTNSLVVQRHGERKFSLPVTAFVLLLIFFHIVTLFLMVVSLFCGYHYKFTGPDLGKDSINDVMDKATKAAEAVKEEFKDEGE
ncbi:MAG: DUF4342 domain-containing protein [Oscillospiraceae bacterium]|nr:DUF4342 domain-containing protein [Oscillospiraceae bacterium]